MKKRSIRKTMAAVKRQEKQKGKNRAKWAKQEQRLLTLIEVMRKNETMQPQEWAEGQVRYYEKLLAAHRAVKPK